MSMFSWSATGSEGTIKYAIEQGAQESMIAELCSHKNGVLIMYRPPIVGLVVRPGAPSSVVARSSKARSP